MRVREKKRTPARTFTSTRTLVHTRARGIQRTCSVWVTEADPEPIAGEHGEALGHQRVWPPTVEELVAEMDYVMSQFMPADQKWLAAMSKGRAYFVQ